MVNVSTGPGRLAPGTHGSSGEFVLPDVDLRIDDEAASRGGLGGYGSRELRCHGEA